MNITMRFSSSSSAGNVDGVGRTKALSSSPAGGALGVDMTFTRRLRQGADDEESTDDADAADADRCFLRAMWTS